MKQFFLFLLMFPAIILAQPKINKITWIGESNEYLKISKRKASFENGKVRKQFKVTLFEKDFFILSSTYYSVNERKWKQVEQKYKFVYFSEDTLIISPVGIDTFQLCQSNDKHQYLFVNYESFPPQTIDFVRLHFETSLDQFAKIILDIDASKRSRIQIIDDRYAERTDIISPIVSKDYERLISILENYDVSRFPKEYFVDEEKECHNSFFEIEYNNQIIRCRGCTYFPFRYSKLEIYITDHIAMRVGLSITTSSL